MDSNKIVTLLYVGFCSILNSVLISWPDIVSEIMGDTSTKLRNEGSIIFFLFHLFLLI